MATVYMLESVTDTINTSFIIKDDSSLTVIDGGFPSEADNLHSYLERLGKTVDAWFFTHIHDDHVGAFITMLDKYDDITVKNVFCNFPDENTLVRIEPNQTTMASAELLRLFYHTVASNNIRLTEVHEKDVFFAGNTEISVLQCPDSKESCKSINGSSCVFSFLINSKRLLFLGDLDHDGGERLLRKYPGELLKSDYVQMSHHGQDGVGQSVYRSIRPDYCFWCTPSWLWDNIGPNGYDTGRFKTITVRGWMSELACVKKHYIMKNGPNVINIPENDIQ